MIKSEFKSKNGQLLKLILLLALAVMAMVFFWQSTHNKAPNPFTSGFIRAGGDTLNIAIEMNPSVYMISGDSIIGRDYEILHHISETKGIPMKFFPFVPLKRAIEGLDEGEFDILVASLPLTTYLKDKYQMTEPVYLDREVLVQRNDSLHQPITSQYELGGDTVWITADSPFINRLSNLSAEIGDTIYISSSPQYSAEALVILTARGIIKYAVIKEGIAKELKSKFSNIDINTPISFTQFQAWALKKGDSTLCDSVNQWIREANLSNLEYYRP